MGNHPELRLLLDCPLSLTVTCKYFTHEINYHPKCPSPPNTLYAAVGQHPASLPCLETDGWIGLSTREKEGRGITSGPIVQPTNLSSSHYVEDGRRVRDVNREGERRCDRGRVEVSDAAFFFILPLHKEIFKMLCEKFVPACPRLRPPWPSYGFIGRRVVRFRPAPCDCPWGGTFH